MRQLIIEQNPDKKGLVIIEGKNYRYLRQVLRIKNGDMIVLRLPDGSLCNSTAASIDDDAKKITLQVCGVLRQAQGPQNITQGPREPQNVAVPEPVEGPVIEYSLFQFIPKPQKMDLIVRQATECGVCNIIPVISEYTEKGSIAAFAGGKTGRLERLERIVKEARQQSGSPVSTKVFEPVNVEQALELWQKMNEGEAAGFILSERVDGCCSVHEAIEKFRQENGGKNPEKIAIVCGNEGGISPEEREFFVKKGLFYPVHFSVNILRCETAALYGIAAVQTGV